jgi:phosphatidate cytidylyltransferase
LKDLSRIISGIVLILLVILATSIGKLGVLFIISLFSFLVLWELGNNFFKFSLEKKLIGHLFLGAFSLIIIYLLDNQKIETNILLSSGMALNLGFISYLFFGKKNKLMTNFVKKIFLIPSIFVSLNLLSLIILLGFGDWKSMMTLILLITYGMDTGGWFFGKNFGKRKLSPTVSPNKTVEGLVGGALFSGVISSTFLHFQGSHIGVSTFTLLTLIAAMTHLGDLAQSKLKREVGIKDSSSLIPGHGGVFDRVDSLYFISPFFVFASKYIM